MKNSLGRRWLSLFLTLVLCMGLVPAALAEDPPDPTPPESTPPVYKVTLTPPSGTLYAGGSGTVTVKVEKDGAEVQPAAGEIAWKSSDETVAKVDGGQLEFLKAGTVTITAGYTPAGEAAEAASGQCSITIKAAVTGITPELSAKKLEMLTGDKRTLSVNSIKDSNGDTVSVSSADVAWKSSNGSVAAVSSSGEVEAKGSGTASITATVKCSAGGKDWSAEVKCEVTVTEKMDSLKLIPNGPIIMDVGRYQEVTASAEPATAKVSWTVTPTGVVDIQSTGRTNNIYARKPGEAEITATIGTESGNTQSAKLSVEVSGLTLEDDEKSITLQENDVRPLPIPKAYGNAKGGKVVWQSSNPSVAQVSGNNVAGRGPGRATITGYVGGNYEVSFTVEVSADEAVTIDLRDPVRTSGQLNFSDRVRTTDGKESLLYYLIEEQANGGLSHITGVHVDPTQGTLYYRYSSPDQPNAGVAQNESYYYSAGASQKDLQDITFVPNPKYTGGKVTINYTVVSRTYQNSNCRIILQVEPAVIGSINLTATNKTPARFSAEDFNSICQQETGANLDYVVFSLPHENQGTLYADYVDAENYGHKVSTGSQYRRSDLDRICFIPGPGFTGTAVVYYTARSAGVSGQGYSGQVNITVNRENFTGNGGPVYNIPKGGAQTFDDEDFNDYYEQIIHSGWSLSHIRFDGLPASSQGTLWYNYRSTGNPGTRVEAGASYYHGTRNPRLDRVTFVPESEFTGTVRIPFTGWDVDGNYFSGNVEINVRAGGGTGDIRYTCVPGRSRDFVLSDFTRLCDDLTGRSLDYIIFEDLPDRYNQGSIYHNNTRVSSTGTRYYNGSSSSNRINRLSFRATNSFTGSVDIPFTGYTRNNGGTFSGVLTIDSYGSSGSYSIRYTTDYNAAAVFDEDDFDDLSRWETQEDLYSVKFEVPSASQGDLYRNYRSSSSKGSRITSSSTTIYDSDLNRVAFVPASGFTGTVYLDFTATARSNGGTFAGTVEIEVGRPSAAVTARYSTRTAPVRFQGEDFRRSGYTLSSIRFSSMPSASEGHLYYRYTSPTQYNRLASVGTSYKVNGSGELISDLTFVPRAGFTGTVTLPYTGSNSSGSTFEGEVIITVSPVYSSSRFNDLGGYSNEQRAAVEYLFENGITNGISSNQYGPELPISRGDFAVMVYNAFDLSPSSSSRPFGDVSPNIYYAQAVNTLYSRGIVSGIGNGNYGPSYNVSRQDAVCMVQRAMRAVGMSANDASSVFLTPYSDSGSVSGYAQGAMANAVQQGYLPTSGGRLNPAQALTRMDMALIIHRVLTY